MERLVGSRLVVARLLLAAGALAIGIFALRGVVPSAGRVLTDPPLSVREVVGIGNLRLLGSRAITVRGFWSDDGVCRTPVH